MDRTKTGLSLQYSAYDYALRPPIEVEARGKERERLPWAAESKANGLDASTESPSPELLGKTNKNGCCKKG